MTTSPVAKWGFLIFLSLGVVGTTAWRWHGSPFRPTTSKSTAEATPPTSGLMPAEVAFGDAAENAAENAAMISAGNTALIVDYRDDVSDAELALTPEKEEPISRWSSADRLYRVRFPSSQAAAVAAARLSRDPRIESVGWDVEASVPPDEELRAENAADDRSMQAECGSADAADHLNFPSDPCYRYQWHLRQLGLPGAWKLGQGGGAVVAVIDTGVSRVPDLADTTFVPGYNFLDDTENAADDHGHGTHVAGTIAQSTHNKLGVGGVAFKASIMPLKVLSARGAGSMAAIAQAIRFAADHGAQVINMSLGGPFPVGAIGSAVKYAREKGVTVVAAAGNDGRGKVGYPARYPGVIAVAATQFDETTTFYSNWGPQIDIAAPGGNVRVDQNGDGKPDGVLQNTVVPGNTSRTDYLWFMGTSMAAPHVAGVAALIVGAGVTKPDAVEEILLGTARKPASGDKASSVASGRIDDHYGAGLVDAGAALTKVRAGRGMGELGLGALMALLGASMLAGGRGRGASARGTRLGGGFVAALLLGSSGLFILPFVFPFASALPSWMGRGLDVLSLGVLDAADSLLPHGLRGTPVIWSALLPVGATALFYGSGRWRGALAGLGFGIAGALLFAAIGSTFDVRVVPDVLDRPWLVANAGLSALVATAVLRR